MYSMLCIQDIVPSTLKTHTHIPDKNKQPFYFLAFFNLYCYSCISAKFYTERKLTNIGELDRVLGGGIVPGSLVLVGGDPGIGKSTLLLQVCRNLAENGSSVLYISGEESLRQIKLRANRIGTFNENL